MPAGMPAGIPEGLTTFCFSRGGGRFSSLEHAVKSKKAMMPQRIGAAESFIFTPEQATKKRNRRYSQSHNSLKNYHFFALKRKKMDLTIKKRMDYKGRTLSSISMRSTW
jgi:hypothetical protein